MKRFECRCGERVFFENTRCLSCEADLGFDPTTLRMATSTGVDDSSFDNDYRVCRNKLDFDNCNWLLRSDSSDQYCVSCQLNRTIPHLNSGNNLVRWATLEREKRRLLYSLLDIGLPVKSKARGWPDGLAFDFIEDQRSNPAVLEPFITTGHLDGVITINVAEADQLYRLQMRLKLGEVYRTVLGHFRHESGHYYFNLLFGDHNMDSFRNVFGNETTDYARALDVYYGMRSTTGWESNFISAYASSHPLEDWAETWAHYLLIWDSLETACTEQNLEAPRHVDDIIDQWIDTAIHFNQTARSLGLDDPYPFVINEAIRNKLRFVDGVVREDRTRT